MFSLMCRTIGQIIYFSHPIFKQYHLNAPIWIKRLLLNAVDILLPEPLVRVSGPSSIVTTLNEQALQKRSVLHLLHHVPERRGIGFDTIEDVFPLYDLAVSVRADKPVTAVTCVPQGQTLDFQTVKGRIEFTLPKLNGHQMIELPYAPPANIAALFDAVRNRG